MNKVKTLITTDMEIDDMNSLIHLSLYLNEIDLLGIIYTSSQYHFNGDGCHMLGEITPNYRCSGPAGFVRPRTHFGPDPDAKSCKQFRPFPIGWIEALWDKQYREAYPFLIQHDSSFPSPEHLISITKYGNIEFEGDVRFDTEGSNMIKDILLEENDDVIYLQSWGGVNTIVRALLSIYEEHGKTEQWPKIKDKVSRKAKILGVRNYIGQDNSYLEHRIPEIYPDIELLHSEFHFGLHKYAKTAQIDCIDMFQSEWMLKHIHNGSSSLMDSYRLLGDGKIVEGEPDIYQFGYKPVIDFGYPGKDPVYFNHFDFFGEGDSNTYIPLFNFGLRGLEKYNYGTLLGRLFTDNLEKIEDYDFLNGTDGNINPFLKSYMEDWAARSRWCCSDFQHANHAPIIKIKDKDIFAHPKEVIKLEALISDPDQDGYSSIWEYHKRFSHYSGTKENLRTWQPWQAVTYFTVPEDAKANDYFSLIIRVQDHAEQPMTRYGQIIIHVIE